MTNTERVRAALRRRQDEQAKREQGIAPAKPPAPARPIKPVPKPPAVPPKPAVPKTEKPKPKQQKPPAKVETFPPPAPKPPRDPDANRLPDGSKFAAEYSAAQKKWKATLTIPGCPEFSVTWGGVWRCMERLDRLYRKWLKEQEPKPEGKKDDA